MDELRRAAREALERRFLMAGPEDARVDRISVDVEHGDQRELVSIRVSRVGGLSWSCTCGDPACHHARVALELISGQRPSIRPETTALRADSVMPDLTQASLPDVRVVELSDQAERADAGALSEAIAEVVTAVARSGLEDGVSEAVRESLSRLLAVAPEPLPLGISRWVGRLEEAIEQGDVDATARVLNGAARVADDLRAEAPDASAKSRIVSWLGALSGDEEAMSPISDRTMLEVAREWLPGVERVGVERRYLIDLADGETYREERAPGARTTSLGPCPRVLSVGLARVEAGAAPRRIRLLQYTASPRLDADVHAQLAYWGVRTFDRLVDRYRDAVAAFPGLAEPFAVVSPESVTREHQPRLLDEAGSPLPLIGADDPSVLACFGELTRDSDPSWVAGRLLDRDGILGLRPLSLGLPGESGPRFERL